MFSINQVRSITDAHGGLDRAAQFEVHITPPPFLSGSPIANDLRFFCSNAALPGFGLQTTQIFHNGYGVQEKRPTASIFEDAQLTFLPDANGELIDFFRQWVQYINPFMVDQTEDRDRFRWPQDYSTILDVRKFKSDGTNTYTYKLHQAYPISIGSVPVDWEMVNTLTRLPVNFAYHSWSFTNGSA